MTWQFNPADFHIRGAIAAFEHDGVPVVIRRVGTYANAVCGDLSTQNVSYVLISVGSVCVGGKFFAHGASVTAFGTWVSGQQRTIAVASYPSDTAEGQDAAIDLAKSNLDAAVAALRGMDGAYAAASTRGECMQAYSEPLARADYETACFSCAVTSLSDDDCGGYGVRHGQFSYPEYSAEYCVSMHLARLRMRHMDAAKITDAATRPASIPAIPKMDGQLWEECERCGAEPIYMPLHLCAKCWPTARNSI